MDDLDFNLLTEDELLKLFDAIELQDMDLILKDPTLDKWNECLQRKAKEVKEK